MSDLISNLLSYQNPGEANLIELPILFKFVKHVEGDKERHFWEDRLLGDSLSTQVPQL